MYDFLSYRPVVAEDARLLLDWRTAPHVASNMLTDVSYDIERQAGWIESCNAREDYRHSIIRIEGRDVGYTSITVTDARNGIGEIGCYIGEANASGAMTVYNFVGTLNHAFFTMGLHKLVNHIVAWNDRVLRVQRFNGYRHIGVLKEHVLKEGSRHDLHIFEQSAAQWAEFRAKFRDNRNWWGEETVYKG